MSESARDRLLAWSLLPFITPARIRLLLEHFSPAECTSLTAPLLQALLRLDSEQAEAMTRAQAPPALRATMVTLLDDTYPSLLREIVDPPLALHFLGDLTLASQPCVAMVGSRAASTYAISAAHHLGRKLVSAGVVIVSGMARGVDAAAHHAALDAGGKTIAVLGTGIDIAYPRQHRRLYQRIAAEGLLLSAFPPGTPARPENFPVRNRIISGLAHGTVIVEATRRSGSLITARCSAEQNREVFVVPGSIFAAGSEGPHRLAQCGAKLVHDVEDILEELPGNLRSAQTKEAQVDDELQAVLDVLTHEEGTHIDALAQKTGRTPASLASPLLQLELGGWVRVLPGGRYVRER